MPMSEWSTIFVPTHEDGTSIPADELPLSIALSQHEPAHATMWIRGLDNVPRHIAVTALPLVGQHDRELGAIAVFWEDAAQGTCAFGGHAAHCRHPDRRRVATAATRRAWRSP
jgi:hypothetical protein